MKGSVFCILLVWGQWSQWVRIYSETELYFFVLNHSPILILGDTAHSFVRLFIKVPRTNPQQENICIDRSEPWIWVRGCSFTVCNLSKKGKGTSTDFSQNHGLSCPSLHGSLLILMKWVAIFKTLSVIGCYRRVYCAFLRLLEHGLCRAPHFRFVLSSLCRRHSQVNTNLAA